MNSRKDAREVAFKLIFEYLFSGQKNDLTFNELSSEFELQSEQDYVSKVYYGAIEKSQELNDIIKQHAKGFSLDRIYKVDKAILFVALYEVLYLKNIPYKVSINEAVELAKKYSTEKSPSFINGILSKVEKD
ncbi:MAG: transcription antitermination factor NusB [Clostridia bacterium]|nr:transcription antitermination factor NusB [Clostridia bacterium]